MSISSPQQGPSPDTPCPPVKEAALPVLALRAAVAKDALRSLTARISQGQKELEVLLGLYQDRPGFEDASAIHILERERVVQHLTDRLGRAQRDIQELMARFRAKEKDGLGIFRHQPQTVVHGVAECGTAQEVVIGREECD